VAVHHEEVKGSSMNLTVEFEQEEDGRWLADIADLPGVMAYGKTREEAAARVQALALRVIADRLEHGEAAPDMLQLAFTAA
jgi:predicted RNase H-like HicB family nuclease